MTARDLAASVAQHYPHHDSEHRTAIAAALARGEAHAAAALALFLSGDPAAALRHLAALVRADDPHADVLAPVLAGVGSALCSAAAVALIAGGADPELAVAALRARAADYAALADTPQEIDDRRAEGNAG